MLPSHANVANPYGRAIVRRPDGDSGMKSVLSLLVHDIRKCEPVPAAGDFPAGDSLANRSVGGPMGQPTQDF